MKLHHVNSKIKFTQILAYSSCIDSVFEKDGSVLGASGFVVKSGVRSPAMCECWQAHSAFQSNLFDAKSKFRTPCKTTIKDITILDANPQRRRPRLRRRARLQRRCRRKRGRPVPPPSPSSSHSTIGSFVSRSPESTLITCTITQDSDTFTRKIFKELQFLVQARLLQLYDTLVYDCSPIHPRLLWRKRFKS